MCEELIEKVGDRFISSELEQAQEERGVDESLLSQSATFGHVSGDFGRPSLARLSIASGQSIGRHDKILMPTKVVKLSLCNLTSCEVYESPFTDKEAVIYQEKDEQHEQRLHVGVALKKSLSAGLAFMRMSTNSLIAVLTDFIVVFS
ncbi:unnamed protein product [Heligmosomoides polygyrus]|uniref:Uncharacterized protein n=1 Tax=Heligmosomoides polygyrus TaxID=6339 RepID=A0A183FQ64_HELPZ|nr:unnamed protein product [Heligmosomoides polygyrus]